MLTVYYSNQLDVLKDLLALLLQKNPPVNPLTSEQILVQSPGMAQWLQLSLAQELDIAAAIDFPLPASFLWKMYCQVLPDVPERSAFNKEAMSWKIILLLDDLIDQPEFSALAGYLAHDNQHIKRYQLASKIADIFDQYLVYRPEWILSWEKGGDLPDITQTHPWQPVLWRELVQKTKQQGQSHWHRANMHQTFNEAMQQKNTTFDLPERIFVFGISALPPHFIESLEALGHKTDIHLLACNPCRYFWGDIQDPHYRNRMMAKKLATCRPDGSAGKTRSAPFLQDGLTDTENGNPLLASIGKLGRDYFNQLFDTTASEIDVFSDNPPHSLLSQIQSDILELKDRTLDNNPPVIPPTDHSVAIHDCHSPLREVEILHDQLLNLFEKHPGLSPKDIVVMLPDVETYTPWIQAVFGQISLSDARWIPFSISDRSAHHEHPVLSGVLQLLNLHNSRFGASDLLTLLEIPALQRKFQLDNPGLEILRQWIEDSGIRWGLSREDQEKFNLPVMKANTWLFGLKRILMGYAMPESAGIYHDILPFEPVQGQEAVLAGYLASFIEALESVQGSLETDRDAQEWTLYINQLLEQFFLPDEDDEYAFKLIRDVLSRLQNSLEDAGYNQPLSHTVLVSYLTEHLTTERNSQRFLAGQVNFCTLMPMRSIPFKVVCLLGMNDGAYPRSIPPAGFDLIARHSKRGDRSRREDDRYLFLEALLSAREKLYISYVGRSISDNSSRAPSVLVSELMDYCQRGYQLKLDLITQHPLQAFSPNNFLQDTSNRLFSYTREWLPAAQRIQQPTVNFLDQPLTPVDQPVSLELHELLRFYRNPCQYFFNHRLKVFFNKDKEELMDSEPFHVDGLPLYDMKRQLLKRLINRKLLTEIKQEFLATGLLPQEAFGDLILNENIQLLQPLADYLQDEMDVSASDVALDLNIHDIQITGWQSQFSHKGLLRYRPSDIKGKDKIAAWIEHLCFCASFPKKSCTTSLVGLDKKKKITDILEFPHLPQDQARQHLVELMKIYLEGLQVPVVFFPETSLAWAVQKKKGDTESAIKAALKTFTGNNFGNNNVQTDSKDLYIQRVYPDLNDVMDAFSTTAERIFNPMLETLEQGK
ncbi:RecBCD enzyme subunit RecC [invertebrate metagenome]|uniref:RecBCD enzyme subunit RecC n=1 Tax=invertebrate metagenome TaxID=1711999 RepID=A0A2H9T819_9ZZZZ